MSRSRSMAVATGLISAALLSVGCHKHKPTEVLDRPELKELEQVKKDVLPAPVWHERSVPPADGHYLAVTTGDFNGDGLPDVAAGSQEPGSIAIWLGQTDDSWQLSTIALPSSEAQDIIAIDLDGDGRDEILAVSRGGIEGVLLLEAPREGPWGRPQAIVSRPGYEALAVGDLNGDGYPDLAAARGDGEQQGGIEVWLNERGESFSTGFAPIVGGSYRDVMLADVNGDEQLDLIGAGWGFTEGVRVLYGDGRGGFTDGPVLGVPGYYRGLALGDVDGDTTLDIVATTYRSGVRVFPGIDPTATPCVPIGEGSFWSAVVADADFDGRFEIYASSTNSVGILSWTHRSECEFQLQITGLPDRDIYHGLTVGQLERGGPFDLIATGYQTGLRAFTTAQDGTVKGSGPRLTHAPDVEEELWADGNDTYTTALGFPEYRIGVDDNLQIRVYNGEELQEVEARVQSDGEVFVPMRGIGSLSAAGLSPTQLKQVVYEHASQVWRDPEIEVVVKDYRAHQISLLGEVRTTSRTDSGPGQYPLRGKTRVVEFVSRHGGPTERADFSRVQLIESSGRSTYLNLFKAVFSSEQGENPILNRDDTIFVPSVSLANRKVFVLGQVREPGLLELRENITLLEAIARSRGFTTDAVMQQVLVIRGGIQSPELISINVRDLFETGDLSADITLENGDVVYVPRKKMANVRDTFQAIQPALQFILDLFILEQLVTD